MANKNLNAVISIGGAVNSTLGTALTGTKKHIANIGKEIGSLNKQQKELKKKAELWKKQGKDVSALEREIESVGNQIDKLSTKYDKLKRIQNVGLGKALNKNLSDGAALAKKAGAAIGTLGAAILGATAKVSSQADAAVKHADKLGISVEALQEFRYAAERSGISASSFDTGLQRMTRRVAEFVDTGKGTAANALGEMGIAIEDLKGLKPEDQLSVIADRMSGVADQSTRVRLAFALFDTEGVGMVNMLKDGSKGLSQMRAEAIATGNVISENAARDAEKYQDSWLDVKMAVGGVVKTFAVELMPVLTNTFKEIKVFIVQNREQVTKWAKDFGLWFKNAMHSAVELGKGLKSFSNVIGKVVNVFGGLENTLIALGFLMAGKFIAGLVSTALAIGKVISISGALPVVAAGIKAISAALVANPIGLAITAIAGAGYLIMKNWTEIKTFFAGLWQSILDGAKAVFSFISSKFNIVGRVVSGFKSIFDSDEAETAAKAQVQQVNKTPIARRGNLQQNIGGITIHAQQGQDPKAIANAVIEAMPKQNLFDEVQA